MPCARFHALRARLPVVSGYAGRRGELGSAMQDPPPARKTGRVSRWLACGLVASAAALVACDGGTAAPPAAATPTGPGPVPQTSFSLNGTVFDTIGRPVPQ